MSYFVLVNHPGTVPAAIAALNKRGVGGRFVMQFIPLVNKRTQIVFKFDAYPDYVWWCEKTGRTPVDVAEWCGALHLSHDEYQKNQVRCSDGYSETIYTA